MGLQNAERHVSACKSRFQRARTKLHDGPQSTTGKTFPRAHLNGQRQPGAGGERVGEARNPAETRISIFGLADSDVGRIVAMTHRSKAPDVELTIPASKRHIVKRKILFQ